MLFGARARRRPLLQPAAARGRTHVCHDAAANDARPGRGAPARRLPGPLRGGAGVPDQPNHRRAGSTGCRARGRPAGRWRPGVPAPTAADTEAHKAAHAGRRPIVAFAFGVPIAVLGELIGLGGAEFRLPSWWDHSATPHDAPCRSTEP